MFSKIKQFFCCHDWNKVLSKNGMEYNYRWCHKCGKVEDL